MRTRSLLIALTAVSLVMAAQARAGMITLTVGSAATPTLSSAANLANSDLDLSNTYDILIPTGNYVNQFAEVMRPMTIEASGGPVTLSASGQLLDSKGIIVTTSSLTVKGITFQGAAIDNSLGGNGAGIRDQSTGATTLRVENSTFLQNQDGILTAGSKNQETVQIINSNFFGNGNPTDSQGQEHALYVGDAASLLVSGSTFCGTAIGHNIKSRATTTTISNTTSYDGVQAAACAAAGIGAGSSSYAIDLPNGGNATLNNDTIIQGALTQNNTMVRYGEEGLPYALNQLLVSDTTLTNSGVVGIGIQGSGPDGTCQLSNTTFTGVNTPVKPASFCTIAAPSHPTSVDEPSMIWLVWLAAMSLISLYLVPRPKVKADPLAS